MMQFVNTLDILQNESDVNFWAKMSASTEP